MSELTQVDPSKCRVTLADRVSLFFRNLPCIPNRIALWWLCRRFRKDADYRHSWFCNIAMPIYDEGVDIETANRAAERLMRHLFKA